MNNQLFNIYGDGEQNRDFIFVKHVVDVNIKACKSDITDIFNIASDKKININQLVDIINEILGKEIDPSYSEPVSGDIRHSVADVHKASTFGFEPSIDFKVELSETIQWFNDKK